MRERLQKIIARAGIASRRHAEQLILSGQVRVNGQVVTELGSKADAEHDRIEAAGRLVRAPESNVYLILHKPPQVVSTMADPEGRKSLRNFLSGVPGRVFPVGRLGYAASGLVLLTSDGEIANRILKAAPHLPQTYWIKLKGRPTEDIMRQIGRETGWRIGRLKSPGASGSGAPNPWYEVRLTEARRDLLRRRLLELGHPVEKIKRIKLAFLDVGTVPEGTYRFLDADEVAGLFRLLERTDHRDTPRPREGGGRKAFRMRRGG